MRVYKWISVLSLLLWQTTSWGQFQQQDLYPSLQGQTLIDQLVTDYKPDSVLSYGQARDTMFALIDSRNDSLACVYSGHRVFLPPGVDPTQGVFMGGSNDGINTEHTWPQNFGAGSGPARSNMHHLYPTRVAVNSARGNVAFGEIVDNQTQEWFYKNTLLTNIPNQNIDLYSESTSTRFEPREDHKGNVARSMFYFYTMYRAEADAADPSYFGLQRETLCRWHHADPVDSVEWRRTMRIADYQDDKANPFVLDCSLLERCYCADINLSCEITATHTATADAGFQLLPAAPNPFTHQTRIRYQLSRGGQVRLIVGNLLGQQWTVVEQQQGEGENELLLDASQYPLTSGLLFYRLEVEQDGIWQSALGKLLLLPH